MVDYNENFDDETANWRILKSGESVDLRWYISRKSFPKIKLSSDSFGGYVYLEFSATRETILDGKKVLDTIGSGELLDENDPEGGRNVAVWGSQWIIRNGREAVEESLGFIQYMMAKPYIVKMKILSASFVNPSEWGDELTEISENN